MAAKASLKNWMSAMDVYVIRKGSPANYLNSEVIGEGGQASVVKI